MTVLTGRNADPSTSNAAKKGLLFNRKVSSSAAEIWRVRSGRAIRSMRRYARLASIGRQGDTALHGEPYPLLIVRPNGTIAYNYAREALKAWDDEFGYELIDAEMQLAYPDQDAALRDLLQRTVQQARERQAILIAAMPSQYDQSSIGGGYVATPTRGGFQPLGGTGTMAGAGSGFGEAGQGGGSQEAAAYGDSSFRTEGSNSASSGGSNGGPSETHADNQSSQNGAGQGGLPARQRPALGDRLVAVERRLPVAFLRPWPDAGLTGPFPKPLPVLRLTRFRCASYVSLID